MLRSAPGFLSAPSRNCLALGGRLHGKGVLAARDRVACVAARGRVRARHCSHALAMADLHADLKELQELAAQCQRPRVKALLDEQVQRLQAQALATNYNEPCAM